MPERWRMAHKNYENLGFQFSDQCILNYVAFNSFAHLPSEYNSFPILTTLEEVPEARISHFAGPIKPWNFTHHDLFILGRRKKREKFIEYLQVRDDFIKTCESIDVDTGLALRRMSDLLLLQKSLIRLVSDYLKLRKNLTKII